MKNKTLTIKGMACAACASSVEKAINGIPEVNNASVNLITEKLFVEYDDNLSIDVIKDTIIKIGFQVVDDNDNDSVNISNKKSSDNINSDSQNNVKAAWKKFIISAVFSVPLLYVAMAPMIIHHGIPLPFPQFIDPMHSPLANAILQLILVIPVIAVGYKFYTKGFKSLIAGNPNMDSLIAIGTTSAVLYSIYNTLQIAIENTADSRALYYETGGMIITLILLGKALETKSKDRTRGAIKKLMGLTPATAIIFEDGKEKEINIEDVKIGNILVVKPGAKIPVDGTVTEGHTAVDESMLTGESMPIDKKSGSWVYGGTINTTGRILFSAEKVGNDTVLASIIKLVEEAQSGKAPIAAVADKVAGIFVPIVCAIALISGIGWFLGTGGDLEFSLSVFISVMVIACPCALGLATPTAIMVGTGTGAENGILIKSGQSLETAHQIETIILDKTGTITEGKPKVTDIITMNDFLRENILQLTASAENGSEHPLGTAIVEAALSEGIELLNIEDFISHTGRGIEAKISGNNLVIGNKKLMKDLGINLADTEKKEEDLSNDGKTAMYISVNKKIAGIIAVADVIKPSAKKAVDSLKKMGIDVIMITGDNQRTAMSVAKEVGIDNVFAEVLPGDKSSKIKEIQNKGKKVAMVGDGINDAPALAQSDIGIAVGSGTEVAIESADIVLIKNDLNDVSAALKLSKSTIRIIKQNLFWAFGYNVIGIPIAAGIPHLLWGGSLLNPMFAAAAMSLSSVSVITNALRLKNSRIIK